MDKALLHKILIIFISHNLIKTNLAIHCLRGVVMSYVFAYMFVLFVTQKY
jgi:predicted protein tyrosine phosphatase